MPRWDVCGNAIKKNHPPTHPHEGLSGKPSIHIFNNVKNTAAGALALAARANSSSSGTYSLATTPLLSPLLPAVGGSSVPLPSSDKLKLSVLNLSQRLFTPRTPRISGATYSDCQRYPSTTSGVPSNN
eukprot:COSAG06_NODE_948_length_11359_cov_6.236146_17_plen_128_part_00